MPPLHEIVFCLPRKPRKSPCISTLLTTLADVRSENSGKFVLFGISGRRVPCRPTWQQAVNGKVKSVQSTQSVTLLSC